MPNNNYRFIFLLNSCFDQSSMEGIIKALEKDDTEWALKQIEVTLIHTVNDLINARGVYLILGVQEGAFNRWEAFKRERRLFS